MASDSSRARIDQFFVSKKKTNTQSPGLKSGRAEKDTKAPFEGSPSAKGSLDNYLVASQDDNRTARPLQGAAVSFTQDPVKRNLTQELNTLSRDERRTFSALASRQTSEPYTEVLSGVPDASAISNVNANHADAEGNCELKQFASDFLSLYCRYIPPKAEVSANPKPNVNKRQGSPSTLVEGDKLSKKRHYDIDTDECRPEVDVTRCVQKHPEHMLPSVISETGGPVLNYSREIIGVTNPVELQSSLRKCSRMSSTSLCTSNGDTPVRVQETPKSTRGSSMFSPGEAFWSEAIQVADGLFVTNDKCSVQASQDIGATTMQGEMKNLEILGNVGEECMSKKMLNEASSRVGGMDMNAESAVKPGKVVGKEASPFPVKHFDFSFEDKNLDEDAVYHTSTVSAKGGVMLRKCGQTETVSVNSRNSAHATKTSHSNLNMSLQEAIICSDVGKRKAGYSKNDHDITVSITPAKESRIVADTDVYNMDTTPSSHAPMKNQLDISQWLPFEVCGAYKKKGISNLYPWQVDCLQVDGVLQKRNLVYCASTSAGKSFVAEILMLRRVLSSGKMALLVLPYVSICAEKAEHLEVLLEPLGKHVRSYYGNQGGGTLPKDTSVAVCTIEKANSLLNKLLEEGRLSEIGIIVIDELHMVGDQSRGYLLELMLTKLRYAAGDGNTESSSGESSSTSSGKTDPAHGLQIVGMSATLPNVAAVAEWLQAALYQTDFRPVPLVEYIKVGSTIFNKEMQIVRTIAKAHDLGGKDPDHIVELCNEVVQEGNSVLIFCSSRKGCESTAKHISKFLKKIPVSAHKDQNDFMDIASAIESLRRSPAGLDPILEETLPSGVAYHHAGLTVEEREVVETCYRRGLVRVLTATSTLAAGVNLPARRVIFRQPRIGRDFIDGTKYKQMAGRAGRTGIDTKGESVLLCKSEEVKRILGILNDGCPPLQSCLSEDKNGMTHAILEVVAGGIVQTANDVHRYVRCTLLNSTKPFEDVVKSAQESLRWLCHRKFLEWNDGTKLYSSTPLGRASFGSSLSPEESLIVLDDLVRAREGFVLSSDLHLVYLVTPTNVEVEPDWELYYERFMQLSVLDQSVGNRVGVTEPFLMHMAHGGPMRTSSRFQDNKRGLVGINKNTASNEQTLRVCKRFYVALILSRLVQETPVAEVCESFKVARGMVQALQENAGRFASMVSAFCERLGWHDLEGLVSKFQNRVSFGVRAEIVELTTIPFVKGSRARVLYKAGLRTPQAVAEASIPEIVKALSESSTWAAQEDPAQRRIQLGVAKKIKNGARKIVLEKAEEARLVAFSAFKSLGLDVPQFPELHSLNAFGNARGKEASTSSGGDTSSSVVGLQGTEHVSAEPTVGSRYLDNVSSEIRVQNSTQVGDMVLERAIEVIPAISPENIVAMVEEPVIPGRVNVPKKGADDAGTSYSGDQNDKMLRTPRRKETTSDKGPVNAVNTPGGFDSFLNLWDSSQEFYFDIHFNKRQKSTAAPFEVQGLAICWAHSPVYYINIPKDLFRVKDTGSNLTPEICSANDDDTSDLKHRFEIAMKRWTRISEIIGKKDVRKFTWNLKVQIKVLKSPAVSVQRSQGLNHALKKMGVELIDSLYYMLTPVYAHEVIDLSIVAWILWPDEEKSSNPNLEKVAKKRLSNEVAAVTRRSGSWKNQMLPAAHNGCCRRVAQIRALFSVLWKLVVSEKLVEALTSIEAPLVKILADMETWGIGVDMKGCLHAREVLARKLRCLEQEAYKVAGEKFSLSSSADIAKILYERLKLPKPDDGCNKSKQHPSTDKHSLDFLRNEHPIIPVIKEHRTLAKLLNSTLNSICSLAKISMRSEKHMLHGHWLQTSTATGRLSSEEPNLQCIEHMVEFSVGNCGKEEDNSGSERIRINARDFFIPTQENWILLAADYSQIELRLMAHFSKDASLIELLSKPHGDVFIMITAKWARKEESKVTFQERDQTKRLVYGILYGMGPNALAEQLNCSLDAATEKIQSFKRCFPGVASWLQEAVAFCSHKGYVETLKGRKRFLSKIKLGNSKEKSKAQRQAVNSICQGSAADIIKIAMINIHSLIVEEIENCQSSNSFATDFSVLRNRCRILLQVHDELILEADASVIKEAALLLQMSMERAASLLVPLHVKLKVGRTWGSLEPFTVEQPADGS